MLYCHSLPADCSQNSISFEAKVFAYSKGQKTGSKLREKIHNLQSNTVGLIEMEEDIPIVSYWKHDNASVVVFPLLLLLGPSPISVDHLAF